MKSNALFLSLCLFFNTHVFSQVFEDFSRTNLTKSYADNWFYGTDSLLWNYVKAKTGQTTTVNKNEAICLNKTATASVYTDTIKWGIKSISFQYEQENTTNITALVFVNNICLDTLWSKNSADSTQFYMKDSLEFKDPCIFKISQLSSKSGQITLDDIYIEYYNKPYYQIDTVIKPTDTLVYKKQIAFGDLVFTEIFADPSPSVSLPEYEYFEIYNTSDSVIKIDSLFCIVNSNSTFITDFTIHPHSYALICSESFIQNFTTSNILFYTLSSLPAITNEGGFMALLNKDTIISSITYSDSWYKNNFKKNGGWSLEKIDVDNISESPNNWCAAQNYLGGTPGFENSVFSINPDTSNPYIIENSFINDSTIQINFSEPIILKSENYTFDDSTKITNIEYYNFQPSIIHITVNQAVIYTKFKVNCLNILDFAFHKTDTVLLFYKYDSLLNYQDILCTEFLTNSSSETSDFFVFKNISNKIFDASDVYFCKNTLPQNFESCTKLSEQSLAWLPQQEIIFTDNTLIFSTDACSDISICEIVLPSIPEDKGSFCLINTWGEIIDSISFSEDWHTVKKSDYENISFKRINHKPSVQNALQWASNEEPFKRCIETDIYIQLFYENNTPKLMVSSLENISEIEIHIISVTGTIVTIKTYSPNNTACSFNLHDIYSKQRQFIVKILAKSNSNQVQKSFMYYR